MGGHHRRQSISSRSSRMGEPGASSTDLTAYRRDSTMSEASHLQDVDMAQDEMFSGPVSESVPSSTTGFLHRTRSRSESVASFTYYDEDESLDSDSLAEHADHDEDEFLDDLDDDANAAVIEDEHDIDGHAEADGRAVNALEQQQNGNAVQANARAYADEDEDLELGRHRRPRRKSSLRSAQSRGSRSRSQRKSRDYSARDPLLQRTNSELSGVSNLSGIRGGTRVSQKLYIQSEDLTIVIAGFRTSFLGFAVYTTLCVLTAGLAYLLFRWLPRWRVRLVGRAAPLRECKWAVIENQWGEMMVQDIVTHEFGQALSAVFGSKEKRGAYSDYDEDMDPVLKDLRLFDYRYIRFCFHPFKDKFVLCNAWKDPTWTNTDAVRVGVDSDEKDVRMQIFGPNTIDIEEKTMFQLLVDEVFHPFYVFQIASIILWSNDEYYYYAACIFVISVTSITFTLIDTKTTMRRLREISRFECDVRVLRSGFWRYVKSGDLVPGDVYEITDPSLTQFPCDSLLLTGDCIVNESMLTGESVPVSKIPTTDETLEIMDLSASSVHPDVAKHMLFCGTKIVRARRPQEGKDDEAAALALAVRTGFNTTKGALIRSMLFPKPSGFKFYRDSFRYISVMAGIALVGFSASFVNFIRLGLSTRLVIVRALDLVTIVIPPALPATLTIGTNFALSRLKQKQIFCISPQRVNVGGKIDVMCFDKTGTLTEEGLDVLGVRVVLLPDHRFSDILSEAGDLLPGSSYERDPTIDYSVHKAIMYTMATCHSLRVVDGELVGDPLDLKMFEFTGWTFQEGEQIPSENVEDDQNNLSPAVARPPAGMEFEVQEGDEPANKTPTPIELGVLKQFEFVSGLRRASVIVRQFGQTSGEVYLKGAPECMSEVCRPESFPVDYEDLLSYYTHRGFRVIGCAKKTIPRLNWARVQRMKRAEAECDLDFLGFIVFENKLKPTTTEIITELGDANIRRIMCTGDNILTAISVARECNLIDPTAHCFVPHFAQGGPRNPLSSLAWESVDNPIFKLDENTLKPLPPPAEADASLPYDVANIRNYTVAVSGDAFRWIVDYASESVLKEMLVVGNVYARMSPDEKHELVEKLQSIDYTCGFCGDGANDCGALKAADVGISLSEAEASVAAPFTSRVFDISCVPQVIREGRAALVTSFSCFKYMSLYSAIQFTSISFLYASASNLGDFQFLFIDLALILPIAIFMGWTGPYHTLSRKRPTASLVSRKVLTPLLGQIALCALIQAVAFQFVRKQKWFIPPVIDPDKSDPVNSENTALYLVSCYQYILSAIVLSVGKPFRQPMRHNLPFVITMVVTLLISSYMLFDPAEWLFNLMQLTYMSNKFKIFLLVLALGGFACAYSSEKYFFPQLARFIGKTKQRLRPSHPKKRKEYKVIQESMAF